VGRRRDGRRGNRGREEERRRHGGGSAQRRACPVPAAVVFCVVREQLGDVHWRPAVATVTACAPAPSTSCRGAVGAVRRCAGSSVSVVGYDVSDIGQTPAHYCGRATGARVPYCARGTRVRCAACRRAGGGPPAHAVGGPKELAVRVCARAGPVRPRPPRLPHPARTRTGGGRHGGHPRRRGRLGVPRAYVPAERRAADAPTAATGWGGPETRGSNRRPPRRPGGLGRAAPWPRQAHPPRYKRPARQNNQKNRKSATHADVLYPAHLWATDSPRQARWPSPGPEAHRRRRGRASRGMRHSLFTL